MAAPARTAMHLQNGHKFAVMNDFGIVRRFGFAPGSNRF